MVYSGKSYEQMDDLGVKNPPILGNTHFPNEDWDQFGVGPRLSKNEKKPGGGKGGPMTVDLTFNKKTRHGVSWNLSYC